MRENSIEERERDDIGLDLEIGQGAEIDWLCVPLLPHRKRRRLQPLLEWNVLGSGGANDSVAYQDNPEPTPLAASVTSFAGMPV